MVSELGASNYSKSKSCISSTAKCIQVDHADFISIGRSDQGVAISGNVARYLQHRSWNFLLLPWYIILQDLDIAMINPESYYFCHGKNTTWQVFMWALL